MNKLLTADELAAFLRTSRAQIYNTINKGGDGVDIPQSIQIGDGGYGQNLQLIVGWNTNYLKRKDKTSESKAQVLKKTINRI